MCTISITWLTSRAPDNLESQCILILQFGERFRNFKEFERKHDFAFFCQTQRVHLEGIFHWKSNRHIGFVDGRCTTLPWHAKTGLLHWTNWLAKDLAKTEVFFTNLKYFKKTVQWIYSSDRAHKMFLVLFCFFVQFIHHQPGDCYCVVSFVKANTCNNCSNHTAKLTMTFKDCSFYLCHAWFW